MKIPFNYPHVTGREIDYIQEAIRDGHLSGNGTFTRRCQAWLEQTTGAKKVLLTHSCTAALEMSAILANVGPGDEVIMPSFTFVSTANAFVLRGATPVFVDIRPDTLNIDERLIPAAITPRTKAIVLVHYAGVVCDMGPIMRVAAEHKLMVIEDAAQALLSTYEGRPAGTFGQLAALSFHETKNIISGEGGALLINDPSLIERAEIIWEKGTNRSRFFRGQVDKYTWVDIGSSFLPSELIAAFLWSQLEHAAGVTNRRLEIWNYYHDAFALLEGQGRVQRPRIPSNCVANGHIYYLIMSNHERQAVLLDKLKDMKINAVFHYIPLHSSEGGLKYGRVSGSMRHTDDLSDRLVRLPLWADISKEQLDRVIDAVSKNA
jgi:dTDP-4-amino-4,6-dideoxygalactose transaminase